VTTIEQLSNDEGDDVICKVVPSYCDTSGSADRLYKAKPRNPLELD
jgi:hypothetical protein